MQIKLFRIIQRGFRRSMSTSTSSSCPLVASYLNSVGFHHHPLPSPLLLLRWIFSCVLVDSWWNVSSCSSSFPSSIRIPPTGPSNSNRNERQFRGGPRQVDPQLSASFSLKYFHEIGNQRTHIRNEDAALTSLPTTIATGTPITITTALVNYKHDQYFVLIK